MVSDINFYKPFHYGYLQSSSLANSEDPDGMPLANSEDPDEMPLANSEDPDEMPLANSEDPDEMLHHTAFHQGLHCLHR